MLIHWHHLISLTVLVGLEYGVRASPIGSGSSNGSTASSAARGSNIISTNSNTAVVNSAAISRDLSIHHQYQQQQQQQRRNSQERLHRAVSRFAATGRGIAGVTEYVMKAVDRSLEKIPAIPSLDPQECMKRSVCEAHNQPDRYGLVGLTLQLIFPPYLAGEEEDAPIISKYQQAARYGRRNDAECGRHFDGCIVSPLEVTQKIINYFIR